MSSPYGGGSPSLARRALGEGGRGGRAGSVDYDKAMSASGGGGAQSPRPRGGSVAAGRVSQLQSEETPAALSFLARRGSEAADSASEVESAYEEEAMANAERELAADAEWKRIQQNTFTR